MAPETGESSPIELGWRRVLEQWQDPSAHDRFLTLASTLNELPEAARRYAELKDDPERGPIAQKRLQSATLLAMQGLKGGQPLSRPPRNKGLVRVLTITIFLLIVAGTLFAIGQSDPRVLYGPR